MTQPFDATDAGFSLDFIDRLKHLVQQAERAARARIRNDAGESGAEAEANHYELLFIAAGIELAETVRDEIRRAVHEAIAASGRGVAVNLRFQNLDELRALLAEHASSRPSEVRDLDTSVESHIEHRGDFDERKRAASDGVEDSLSQHPSLT